MTDALVLENFVNGNENACLLHVAEAVVDGCAEESHCRRQRHIGVDKWRNVVAKGTYLTVENEIVLLEIVLAEQLGKFFFGRFNLQRLKRNDEVVLVVEVLLEEIEYHVASTTDVRRIHCHLAEEVLNVGFDDGEGT